MYYYPTGGVADYIYGVVVIVTVVVAIIFLLRFEKSKNYSKYHNVEFLRTLSVPELRFYAMGADALEDIDQVIEEKLRS